MVHVWPLGGRADEAVRVKCGAAVRFMSAVLQRPTFPCGGALMEGWTDGGWMGGGTAEEGGGGGGGVVLGDTAVISAAAE